jgi:hypothetical protein
MQRDVLAISCLRQRFNEEDDHLIADGYDDSEQDQLQRGNLDGSAKLSIENLLNKRTMETTPASGTTTAFTLVALTAIPT